MFGLIVPDELLLSVSKPARYIGGEINMVNKNLNEIEVRFALCFPDVYDVGMSHLGMDILYFFMNRRKDTYCERVYAPWHDMEEVMVNNNIPLFSLETQQPVKDFDIVGFTLQYEMCYTNVINMLKLSGIPVYAKDRNSSHPVICAGGPCAYNPEPLADIVDFFYIGEAEYNLDTILEMWKKNKIAGYDRDKFLERLLHIDGVYVPKFYDVAYNADNTIKYFRPNNAYAKTKIKKAVVNDIDKVFYPDKQLVPLIEIVNDRVTLELFRGCLRGCRFCQAGFISRPVREKSPETIVECAKTLIDVTGHEEISLMSLSSSDYSRFQDLVDMLIDEFSKKYINLSLPSLRIDKVALDIMKKVSTVRKSSLTFAPEAGTQRMRDVINKNLTESEILDGFLMAYESGWDRVKLYFMIGLPSETDEDVIGISKLAENIVDKYYELPKEKRKRQVSVSVGVSNFVPKPFTPFQWDAQNIYSEFTRKHNLIRGKMKRKQIKYNYHDSKTSIIEGILARGDRRLSKVLVKASELGCKFDGWGEYFDYDKWLQAFEYAGINMEFYYARQREFDEILPWDHINIGVSKGFLVSEREKAQNAITTPSCGLQCSDCGLKSSDNGGFICEV